MIKLPKNRVDADERLKKGIDEVLEYVAKQIEHSYSTNRKDDVVSIVRSGSECHKGISLGVEEKFFDEDILEKAMKYVGEQGYHVWKHTDYRHYDTYWITCTPKSPHPWFSQVF